MKGWAKTTYTEILGQLFLTFEVVNYDKFQYEKFRFMQFLKVVFKLNLCCIFTPEAFD